MHLDIFLKNFRGICDPSPCHSGNGPKRAEWATAFSCERWYRRQMRSVGVDTDTPRDATQAFSTGPKAAESKEKSEISGHVPCC